VSPRGSKVRLHYYWTLSAFYSIRLGDPVFWPFNFPRRGDLPLYLFGFPGALRLNLCPFNPVLGLVLKSPSLFSSPFPPLPQRSIACPGGYKDFPFTLSSAEADLAETLILSSLASPPRFSGDGSLFPLCRAALWRQDVFAYPPMLLFFFGRTSKFTSFLPPG